MAVKLERDRETEASVLDLGPMYATDRQMSSDMHHRLMHPPYGGGSIIMLTILRPYIICSYRMRFGGLLSVTTDCI